MSISDCATSAPPTCVPTTGNPTWHAGFLKLLPAICRQARRYCRGLDSDEREEAIADVAASSLIAYRRLVELGKTDLAYATHLALYACR